jgi:type IV secretory pathway VirB9-like protein
MLHPEETIRDLIGGDRSPVPAGEEGSPWHVQGAEGSADLFLVVDRPGLITGITVTTSARRRYYLVARSVTKSKVRAVRWTYADDPRPLPPREVPWPNVA